MYQTWQRLERNFQRTARCVLLQVYFIETSLQVGQQIQQKADGLYKSSE